MKTNKSYLLGIYTKSPLHVGSGTSVDIVDLPIIRERITNYPVIPGSAVKGVLRQTARDCGINENAERALFGTEDTSNSYAGAMSFGEAKLLAWPVRSLKGCFAWITCPLALKRFARDSKLKLTVPEPKLDHCYAPAQVSSGNVAVLEEYPLTVADKSEYDHNKSDIQAITNALKNVSDDVVWISDLEKKLIIVNDENFQHFVTTTTEIVARIAIDPKTRTNTGLFNQENTPSEALYYSACTYLGEHTKIEEGESACQSFDKIFTSNNAYIQFGGNETIGLGLCEVKKSVVGGE